MPAFKSGDLVTLKSGGPVMTIDTVNTDIFDDDKIMGLLCVWFVGSELKRARFDPQAIDLADAKANAITDNASKDLPGDYAAMIDSMVGALNTLSDQPNEKSQPRRVRNRKRVAVSGDTAHIKN